MKKPEWLRQKAPQGERFQQIKDSLSHLKLNTVCEEAQCPNIGEVSFNCSVYCHVVLIFDRKINCVLMEVIIDCDYNVLC